MDASLKVLGSAPGRKIAVLGDMLELGSLAESAHHKVGETAFACGAEKIFSYGKASYHIMLGAVEAGMPKNNVVHSIDSQLLVTLIKEVLRPGDTILFKASRKMKLEEMISSCGLSE